MRVLLQRVSSASVHVRGASPSDAPQLSGRIGQGYLLLVGITQTDTEAEVQWMTSKVLGLRLFADDEEKLNLALSDVDGELLVVSQFTLYGDARKGRRPSFVAAAAPAIAVPLYELFIKRLRAGGSRVATGSFGAMMDVELVNDGPVTLWLEREAPSSSAS